MLSTAGVVLMVGALVAQAPVTSKIGVFDIVVSGLDPSFKQTAVDTVASAAAEAPGYTVISRSELDAMLGAEKLKDSLGCDEVSCLAEIGAAAGVDHIVTGSVGKVGEGVVITLQLINAKFASVENRVTQQWEGPLSALADVIGAAVDQLILTAKERTPASLHVAGIPVDAAVAIDGKARGVGPVDIADLAVGPHTVHIEAPGYQPFQTAVALRSGKSKQLDVQLSLQPEAPFYTTWWFWTAAGVLVAGGITGAVIAATRGTDNSASGTYIVPPLPGTQALTGAR
jgi:hypothetical protein